MSTPAPARAAPSFHLTPLLGACLAATWLIWGSTYLAIRFALAGFPPFLQMGSRFLLAGILLLGWARLKQPAPWPTTREWLHALVVGGIMLGGGLGGCATAEQTVGSGVVVSFVAVAPLLLTIGGALFLGERPTRLETIGIAVGLAGVVLLVRGESFSGSPRGLVAMLIATSSWCTGSLLSRRACPLAPGAMGFASEMLCGGLVLSLVSLASGETADFLRGPAPSAGAWIAWAYLVVFGSLIAFSAYMALLAAAPIALAASYAFVNPIVGMALGVALGGETISRHEWVAAIVILAGVVLVTQGRRRT